ncbi:hypothetical protein J5H79_25095, partial [Providencia rettgeri]|nr:hypothetical protein [Providencia rettgeri]
MIVVKEKYAGPALAHGAERGFLSASTARHPPAAGGHGSARCDDTDCPETRFAPPRLPEPAPPAAQAALIQR